jgi:hypothetical protein
MLALALRVYDNDYGSIRFNGMDLKRYAQEHLRACIGVVAWDTINLTTRSATMCLTALPGRRVSIFCGQSGLLLWNPTYGGNHSGMKLSPAGRVAERRGAATSRDCAMHF